MMNHNSTVCGSLHFRMHGHKWTEDAQNYAVIGDMGEEDACACQRFMHIYRKYRAERQ